jgi:hypothetical protein
MIQAMEESYPDESGAFLPQRRGRGLSRPLDRRVPLPNGWSATINKPQACSNDHIQVVREVSGAAFAALALDCRCARMLEIG